jgi:hypothetical protein
VSGWQKSFFITDEDQTYINSVNGLAYDPSSQNDGVYDRIYLINNSTDNDKRGLYSADTVNETYSSRLASLNNDSFDTVAVDASGTAYAIRGASGTMRLFKVTDPQGLAEQLNMLGTG